MARTTAASIECGEVKELAEQRPREDPGEADKFGETARRRGQLRKAAGRVGSSGGPAARGGVNWRCLKRILLRRVELIGRSPDRQNDVRILSPR